MNPNHTQSYKSRLIVAVACLLVAAILVGSGFYMLFNNALQAQINQLGDYAVSSAVATETKVRQQCREVFDQITFDNTLAALMYYQSPSSGELLAGIKRLSNYRDSSEFIDSIYIYNAQNNTFYVSSDHSTQAVQTFGEMFDRQACDLVRHYRDYDNLEPISREVGVSYPKLETARYISYLRYNALQAGTPSVLIINVSQSAYLSGLWQPSQDVKFRIDLVDKQGISQLDEHEDLSALPHIRGALENDGRRGHYVAAVDGQSNLVFFDAAFSDYWIICYAISRQYVASLFGIRTQMSWLVALILLLAALVTLAGIIVRKLIRFQAGQQQALEDAREQQRERAYQERCRALRRLLMESARMTKDDLIALQTQCMLAPQPGQPLTLILMHQRSYNEFCRTVDMKRQELTRFSTCELALEITKDEHPLLAVDIEGGNLALVLQCDVCHPVTETLVEQLEILLEIRFDALIAQPVSTLGELSTAFRWGMENLPYLQMQLRVLDWEMIHEAESLQCVYPEAQIRLMLGHVMQLDMLHAARELHEVLERMTEGSYKGFHVALVQMLAALDECLTTLISNNAADDGAYSSISLFGVASLENVMDIENTLCSLLAEVESAVAGRKDDHYTELMERIEHMIEERFHDAMFSVNDVAEATGYSSTYVGRIYRRCTGTTLSERILKARMDYARMLLMQTDAQVKRISEQSGFADVTYFYKAFKKANGVTPNVYRQNKHNA